MFPLNLIDPQLLLLGFLSFPSVCPKQSLRRSQTSFVVCANDRWRRKFFLASSIDSWPTACGAELMLISQASFSPDGFPMLAACCWRHSDSPHDQGGNHVTPEDGFGVGHCCPPYGRKCVRERPRDHEESFSPRNDVLLLGEVAVLGAETFLRM